MSAGHPSVALQLPLLVLVSRLSPLPLLRELTLSSPSAAIVSALTAYVDSELYQPTAALHGQVAILQPATIRADLLLPSCSPSSLLTSAFLLRPYCCTSPTTEKVLVITQDGRTIVVRLIPLSLLLPHQR